MTLEDFEKGVDLIYSNSPEFKDHLDQVLKRNPDILTTESEHYKDLLKTEDKTERLETWIDLCISQFRAAYHDEFGAFVQKLFSILGNVGGILFILYILLRG